MPNIGRPSRACQPCRNRRIRCNLARPGCTQCLKKGLACHGYRDERSGRFQIETADSFLVNIKIDGRKKHALVETEDQYNYTDKASTPSLLLSPSSRSFQQLTKRLDNNNPLAHANISKPLSETWTTHIMPLAYDKFAFACPVFATVQRLLSRAEEGSAAYLATYAVGCAYLATMDRSKTALSRRVKAYAQAISAMNVTLCDAEKASCDTTLLGVWLLGIYELLVATPEKAHKNYAWDAHNQGLMQLIRVRGPRQFQTQDGRHLFSIIFNNLHSRVLAPGQQYFREATRWFQEMYRHCARWEYPLLRVYLFSYKCMRVCSSIRELLAQKIYDHRSTMSILREVDELEKTADPRFAAVLATDWPINLPSEPYDFLNVGYMASYILQSNYRLRVTCHVKDLLDSALCVADNYTPQMVNTLHEARDRCLNEVNCLKEKIQSFLPLIRDARFRGIAQVGADIFLHQPLLQ